MKSHLLKTGLVSVCCLAHPFVTTTVVAQSPSDVDIFSPGYEFGATRNVASRHFFRLGVLAGLSLDADFGVSTKFDISHSRPGVAGSGGEHFYDDGFVRVDKTGNAQGYTSFWGYNDASQAVGNTLTMHSAKSFTADTGDTSKGDGVAVGAELVYGGLLTRHNDAFIGWEFGFGYLPVSIEGRHALEGQVTRTVHTFDTGGIVLPAVPYTGGDSGIGPTIHDLATALPDEDNLDASLNGRQILDADMFLFRLGPTLFWNLQPRWALSVSLGGAVGFMAGDLKFKDTLSVFDGSTSLNSGSVSDTDLAFGGYLSGTITYHVEEHGDLYLSLQYMPMSSFTIEGGGRRAELDMMGSLFISAGLNWPF